MDIPRTEIQLDEWCIECEGTGEVENRARTDRNQPRMIPCDVCRGAGALLTVTGRELTDFIERHFGIRRLG